ncbi:multidrug effflux MFS transporter [Pseudooceanicola sp. CBS1P-1]|uniref:Bcr/CflA family efflux transporter n=1 Tax=Pseudooceanicola albus TaxID=2692189 RepID=A0A6L7GA69_9RHOB|nr:MULTISPECIES: multidrug effflux MFS transporter [Pseudooceanicola]MBT9386687.1 multidrug effflux MFS transporter [Pseudooceanicola endophyticus]MXN20901.1 Bcr/CflA family efflux MFS transporter [Pseudooceanicola albus]
MPGTRSPAVNIPLITAVLALLSVFPPVATDMYLSAMGDLSEALNASASATEMSLSLFFLGLCVGQLIMGPLIDGYGRKGPLLVGAALFTLTSVGLLVVRDVTVFNTLRVLQAIGACAGMVVGRAVVNDLMEGRAAAKMMTVLVMLMTIGPIASPFLGSLLLTAFGWQSIFVAMVLVGAVALVLAKVILPETLPAEARTPAPFRAAFGRTGELLRRPGFLSVALIAALVQGAMFAFITGSSGIFQGVFGLGSMEYGLVFALVAVALVVFGQLNSLLLNRYEPRRIVSVGLPVFVLAGVALLVVSGTSQLWVYVVPLWVAIGMVGLLSANAMSIAMESGRGAAGLASALVGAIQFGVAFLDSSAVAMAGSDRTLPMTLGILLPGALALLLWLRVMRREAAGAGARA